MKRGMLLVGLFASAHLALADLVECTNGDRYTGKVLLVNETDVRLQNDIHGVLTIPRSKVTFIQFHATATPPSAAQLSLPKTAPEEQALKFDPAAIQQVQRELLGTANPEANQLFQEMVQGLASGSLNVGDIRSKARSTLDELRELQKELGDDDTAGLLNSYASILENFLKHSGTNAPGVKPTQPALKP